MKRTSLAIGVVAVALMAATAGGSAAQTAPTAANWISCQRQDLCTITHRRASRAGIRKLVPQKSASACSAAGFSYYLPVSSLEITMGNFVGWGSQMVRFFHEDDPTGQLFSCAFNVNPKYRREALLAGRRAYGWPVSPPVPSAPATPAAAAEQLGASGVAGADATPRRPSRCGRSKTGCSPRPAHR